ncbi:MAG: lipocalin family protein [Burkholderiales bacterium]|jgi:apolipoprotein D and lipocalin family protein|nr:lipocalin family protein [Burkholderiales bacterium]
MTCVRLLPGLLAVTLLAACANPGAPAASADLPPLKTVAQVDLQRYLGTWYEIARMPFGIQDRNCARATSATYSARADGAIDVLNRCQRADGTVFAAQGVARVVDSTSNARLEVTFLPQWLRWLPIGRGDYWVIELAPDYSYVVVGEPQRRYLWILARTPTLDAATLRGIAARLPAHGYDSQRLVPSPGLSLPAGLGAPRT